VKVPGSNLWSLGAIVMLSLATWAQQTLTGRAFLASGEWLS
jgi:hypothetical protein